jgi:hypothetical protein
MLKARSVTRREGIGLQNPSFVIVLMDLILVFESYRRIAQGRGEFQSCKQR